MSGVLCIAPYTVLNALVSELECARKDQKAVNLSPACVASCSSKPWKLAANAASGRIYPTLIRVTSSLN
jgi:hypothetical protein